jgi:hypothetical protein
MRSGFVARGFAVGSLVVAACGGRGTSAAVDRSGHGGSGVGGVVIPSGGETVSGGNGASGGGNAGRSELPANSVGGSRETEILGDAGASGDNGLNQGGTESEAGAGSTSAGTGAAGADCVSAQSKSAPPCPTENGWFVYVDKRCYLCGPQNPSPPCTSMGYSCESSGDGLCYRLCTTSADCPDPCTPFCRKIYLYSGGDQCGYWQSVCLPSDRDIC